MKKMFLALCAVGLLLAGCTTPKDDDATTTTANDDPPSTELGVGVTDDTIKVGVTYSDLSAIKDIVNIDHGDYLSAFRALADDINANGGINGRTIEIVDGPVDPVGTDSATTVCTALTEDEQVFAVLGNVQADVTSCYVTDHETALVGGQMTAETVAAATAPWFAYDATLDFTAEQTVKGALADGQLDGATVGIVGLPVHDGLIADTLVPMLEDAGVDVTTEVVLDAPPDDQAAADAQALTFAERFRADGVDTVITVGDAFLVFARVLPQTQFRPELVATDRNVVETYLVGRSDFAAFEGGVVVGGPAPSDIGWTAAPMQDCIDKILAVDPDRQIDDPIGATADTPNTWVSVTVACQAMTLFQAIAEKAGDTLNNDTFRAAGDDLGEIEIPGKGGPSTYSAEVPSGNPPVFLATWDAGSEAFVTQPEPVS